MMTPTNIPLREDSRFIVLSDCHRGDGSAGDEFARNSLIYKCALEYYLEAGFTYIELGDAEELWENDDFEQIYITHTSVYDLLRRFHDPDPAKTRYLKVWGNHDEDWHDDPAPLRSLFPGIQVHEAIVIRGHNPISPGVNGDISGNREASGKVGINGDILGDREAIDKVSPFIVLLHGHQADPTCSGPKARFTRFLVRHLWSGFQKFGLGDPTRAAENPGRCDEIDDTLHSWAYKWGHLRRSRSDRQGVPIYPIIVIAGHTHRPVFENLSLTERRCLEAGVGTPGVRRKEKADPVYYNTGSCVHPRCITGIEITAEIWGHNPNSQNSVLCPQISNRTAILPRFTLVKWGHQAGGMVCTADGCRSYPLAIARTVLETG